MRAVIAIARRELGAIFGSPVAWVLLTIYLVLSGYFFYSGVLFFVTFGAQMLPTGLWRYVFLDIQKVLMLVLPLVTMRLFAEERKLGTIELLWTYPVRDHQIVAGKFLAALAFLAVLLGLTAFPFLVFHQLYAFDVAPPLAGFLGLALLGTLFVSCGLAASTLTENQVVAAMITYGTLVFAWFLTWNEGVAREGVIRVLGVISLYDHFYGFCLGIVDLSAVVYFLAASALFLFLALCSLESRAWRGVA